MTLNPRKNASGSSSRALVSASTLAKAFSSCTLGRIAETTCRKKKEEEEERKWNLIKKTTRR
jgi:hypothetical protein